ncbi:MAG TPA: hypothetical protein DCM38_13860 [Gammaproteobacteria bacterium]|nr:hypothetical protein [Gammaproteobacteria bacterium]
MLPLQKVVLFKHGVGHFEREGQISGNASIDLYFRASEMNDVLKSLTVLDLNGGVITSISYESTLPIEEQLKDIAIRLPENNALTGLLSQVQGARVAVEIGQETVKGIVTGIETVKRQMGEMVLDCSYLSLLIEGGALQSFDVMEAKQIILLDENLKKDLQHLLDVLISAKKKDLKKLTVFLKGEGERTINMSYIVAAPVWKTAYRLLLSSDAPLIQGWAVVDNTQDEDWENVSLSLVAGLPVSFIHDLYSPRYQKRPEVKVKTEAAYAPPQSEKTLRSVSAAMMADEEISLDDDLDLSLDDDLDFAMLEEVEPCLSKAAFKKAARKHSVSVQTRTVEVGDLFQYEIENPVTVRRQQSALVPILQTGFSGERVVVYNADVRYSNPMSALLFKNTTGLTLESGPLTVFEDEAYLGEAMLDTLKPDEEQFVSFSVELGCVVSLDHRSHHEAVHQVTIRQGHLALDHYEMAYKTYVINNKTERDLDFVLEHRFNQGWELVETPAPVENTEHFYRFRFEVPAKTVEEFTVRERIVRSSRHVLKDTARSKLSMWLDRKYIDNKTWRTLEGVVQLTEKISQIQRDIKDKEDTIKAVFKNQERVRENLQALGNTTDEQGLRELYIAKLASEEETLAQSQADIETLKAEKDKTESHLNTQLKPIEFEARI